MHQSKVVQNAYSTRIADERIELYLSLEEQVTRDHSSGRTARRSTEFRKGLNEHALSE